MRNLFTLFVLGVCATIGHSQTLLFENFDAGIPASWTIVDGGTTTGTWTGTVGGRSGNYLDGTEFVIVDSDLAGNGVTLTEGLESPAVDASTAAGGLILEFDQYFNSYDSGDSAFVDVFDGTNWVNVLSMGSDFGNFGLPDHQVINITAYANSALQVRFRYDDKGVWAWYYAIDNVSLIAAIPNDVAVSKISSLNGRAGTSTALISTENILVDISNLSGLPQTNIPISLVLNGGTPITETMAGPIPAFETMSFTFATTVDLSSIGSYNIEVWTAQPGDGEMSNDTSSITVMQVPNDPLVLPYCESFEGMQDFASLNNYIAFPGAMQWDFETDIPGEGRVRSNAGAAYPHTGTQSITLDRFPDGDEVTNYATGTFNLAAYDANNNNLGLSFYYMEHGDELQPNDLVWIRGSETDAWIQILDWNAGTGGLNGAYFGLIDLEISDSLLANGQNYSNTTQLRFGQQDNFPTTDITVSDGFTFDDVKIRELFANDLSATAILSPSGEFCGEDSLYVTVQISNLGTGMQSNFPVEVNLSGGIMSSMTTIVTDTLESGEEMTVLVGPFSTLAGGMVDIAGSTNLAGDQDLSNNSATSSVDIIPIITPTPMLSSSCNGADAYAMVTAVSGTTFQWFDAPDGAVLGDGESLLLGPLTADSTVYVQSATLGMGGGMKSVGPVDNAFGGGGQYIYFTDGMLFDVKNKITLDSVYVYPESSGDISVYLQNSAGDSLNLVVVPVTVDSGSVERVLIPLGFEIEPGTGYQLSALGSTVPSLFRNNGGAVFPYSTTDIDITGPINTLAGFYYFFYDWKYTPEGCKSDFVAVTVGVSNTQVSVVSSTNISCNGGADGAVTIAASGGNGAYTYLWSNGATTTNLTGLSAGDYSATITDASGCSSTTMVTLTEPDALTTSSSTTNISCNGGADGTVTLTASGGNGAYTYLWSTAATTANLTGLSAGDYSATTTDALGCSSTTMVTLTEPAALAISSTATPETGVAAADGTLDITLTGGTPPYLYEWSNSSTTEDLSGLTGGDYTVTATDNNGCTITLFETVETISANNDIAGLERFELAPNPTSGQLTISLELKHAQDIQLTIFAMDGRKINDFQTEFTAETTYQLDLSTYPSGIYLARLLVDGKVITRRVVVSD